MKILIVGAGAVGFNLTKQLSKEGHDISVVEKSPDLVRRISEKLDVRVVSGSASSPTILEEAGIKKPIYYWQLPTVTRSISWHV